MRSKPPSAAKTQRRRRPAPPKAEVRTKTTQVHGVTLRDDYDWLRAANWKEVLREPEALPADIRAYLEAENAYAAALMAPTRALQRELVKEMRGRLKEDDSSVPQPDGPFLYYSRYRRGAEHPLICRKPRGGKGRETVMLDADALAEGKDFFDLADTAHSPDHRLLAWSADEAGSELHTIRVRDLASGEDLPDAVPTPPATSSGPPTAAPSSMSGSTPTTAPRRSCAIASAIPSRMTACSTMRRMPACSSTSTRRSPADSC